jgi:hypothetical protein
MNVRCYREHDGNPLELKGNVVGTPSRGSKLLKVSKSCPESESVLQIWFFDLCTKRPNKITIDSKCLLFHHSPHQVLFVTSIWLSALPTSNKDALGRALTRGCFKIPLVDDHHHTHTLLTSQN